MDRLFSMRRLPRRLPNVLGLLLVAMLLLMPISAHAQEQSLLWERFDVTIQVDRDGSFAVTESQTIRFTSGTFRFGFREIPVRNFSYLDNWSITDSEGNRYLPASSGQDPYTFVVNDRGGRYEIRWYFPPLNNRTVTYDLSYTVHGGLRYYEGGDQLWWKAIYGDRSFPVLNGRVRVTTPAAIQEWAAYINERDARDSATATLIQDGRDIVFDLDRRLNSGEEFEVRVEFAPGVAAGQPQPWQAAADAAAAQRAEEQAFQDRWGPIATLAMGALGALFLLGGPALLYLLWYNKGRDKPVQMIADYLPEPPDDLPPGVVGTLLDETADMQDILATLVDLARRKAISITEEKKGKFFTSTDFIYRRERDDVPMNAFERLLLDRVFGKKDEVELSDLKNTFYRHLPDLRNALYKEVTDRELFVGNPEKVRNLYAAGGVVALIGAGFLGFILMVALIDLTPAAILPGFGLGVTAVGFLILGRYMPRKTDKGAEIAARWQAFRTYLKDIQRYGGDLEQQKAIWDRWLPYAIAFGVDKEYIRQFEAVNAPAPGWYVPRPDMYGPYRRWYYDTPGTGPVSGGGRGPGQGMNIPGGGMERGGSFGGSLSDASRGMGTSLAGMSAGLGGMLSSASRTMTSRPSSSSSSGGGWSGGGGGFSGGGSFGGGGGGGGRGGFG